MRCRTCGHQTENKAETETDVGWPQDETEKRTEWLLSLGAVLPKVLNVAIRESVCTVASCKTVRLLETAASNNYTEKFRD